MTIRQTSFKEKIMEIWRLEKLVTQGLAKRTIFNGNEAFIVNIEDKPYLYACELRGFNLARCKGLYQ